MGRVSCRSLWLTFWVTLISLIHIHYYPSFLKNSPVVLVNPLHRLTVNMGEDADHTSNKISGTALFIHTLAIVYSFIFFNKPYKYVATTLQIINVKESFCFQGASKWRATGPAAVQQRILDAGSHPHEEGREGISEIRYHCSYLYMFITFLLYHNF